jgi:hypothetical protein
MDLVAEVEKVCGAGSVTLIAHHTAHTVRPE